MRWLCPDCETKSLVIIDATYKEPSKVYCQECKKYKSFNKFIKGNKHILNKENK